MPKSAAALLPLCVLLCALQSSARDNSDDVNVTATVLAYDSGQNNVYMGDGWNVRRSRSADGSHDIR